MTTQTTHRDARPATAIDLEHAARARQAQYIGAAVLRAFRRVGAAVAAFADYLDRRAERSRTLGELRELNDRMLADIGLTRGDVESGVLPARPPVAPVELPRAAQAAPAARAFVAAPAAREAANHNATPPARAA